MSDLNRKRYRFSEAPLWEIQRKYYEEEGMRAWKSDQVPQYITSNPMIANTYAEMIFAFLQDRANKGHRSEPVNIVELGAGAGRLAYHILYELCQLRDYAGASMPPFRYIITDLAMKNVLAWKEHAALQPFAKEGLLDFAAFDAVNDEALQLVLSGETIQAGDLSQPIMLIANYFFDVIPQELIYVGEGKIYEVDVRVEYPEEHNSLKPSEALKHIKLEYEARLAPEYEQEDYPYRDVVKLYQEQLEDSNILFPAVGLTMLERINRWSREGFLLLTADKGDHLLESWRFDDRPELILNGSFSLTANYHAIKHVYEQKGAVVLFPPHYYKNINIGCFLHLEQPLDYINTRLAYRRSIERFGPDEFFSLKEWVDRNSSSMELPQFVSFWRLGGYDAEFFAHNTAHISRLLSGANAEEKQDLLLGIQIMWSSYYYLGQRYDLALEAGLLLFEMDFYEESRGFLEISVAHTQDGVVSTVYYCLAICCLELGAVDEGAEYLRKLLELEPEHEEALALLEAIGS